MLEISDLVCRYGKVEAIKGISLSVKQGQLVALIGANSAGKSTTLRSISGILPAPGGGHAFRRRAANARDRSRHHVQTKLMMFDEPSLGLAPNIVEHVFEIIDGIRQSGTTILRVEQNAYAALDMCDCAYLMEAGSIVLSGRGSELIDNKHVREAYLGG